MQPGSALAAARDEGKLTPPFGQFPYLEVDGASIGQSATIMRFVCNRAGLMPSNEIEAAKADSVAEQVGRAVRRGWLAAHADVDPGP